MTIDFLLRAFEENRDRDALVWQDQTYSYAWLLDRTLFWQNTLINRDVRPGTVVVLEGNYAPESVALFLALLERQCIVVPLTAAAGAKKAAFIEIAQAGQAFTVDCANQVHQEPLPYRAVHPLYDALRQANHPGLVIFSSGSSGQNKAIVHDMVRVLEKFKTPRKRFRTVAFLLFDHIGGINTLFYTLANTGCAVVVQERSPDAVLRAVAQHRVELLPTSPTFINLILFSEAYEKYDLSSLKMISYGTEPMPGSTLQQLHALFPHLELRQTYGLSELGVLRSKSRSSDSLWVKVGGESFQTRVVDGILQIKAESAMLGYLNAPAPFTEDGWFITGDRVEVEGDYIRILGRDSEIINVGGEKVYPIEVESVIQELATVQEVTVYGEKNPITGNIVCAKVRLAPECHRNHRQFTAELKQHCRQKLQSYKVPVKVTIANDVHHNTRLKKVRRVAV